MTHTAGFPPRALHLEWGAHSLALTTCPQKLLLPLSANAKVIQVVSWASWPDSSLGTGLGLGSLQGPVTYQALQPNSPFSLGCSPPSAHNLLHPRPAPQPFPTSADLTELLSSESPVQLGTAPWRTCTDVPTRLVDPKGGATCNHKHTGTMNTYSQLVQALSVSTFWPLYLLFPT